MTLQRLHDVQFFVYILESPSHADFYASRSEGDLVAKAVALNGIPCVVRSVTSREMLERALRLGFYEEMLKHPNRVPILHLSAHGDSDGICLTDGTSVTWLELREYLKPFNQAFSGNLLLCMSSCEGYGACRMAKHPGDLDFPYGFIVANLGKPTWAEAAVAYAAFYHYLAAGQPIPDAISAMKAASGNDGFVCESAQASYESFIEYLKNSRETQEEALVKVEQNLEQQDPGSTSDAKARLEARDA
jgi:hypothetical protein